MAQEGTRDYIAIPNLSWVLVCVYENQLYNRVKTEGRTISEMQHGV